MEIDEEFYIKSLLYPLSVRSSQLFTTFTLFLLLTAACGAKDQSSDLAAARTPVITTTAPASGPARPEVDSKAGTEGSSQGEPSGTANVTPESQSGSSSSGSVESCVATDPESSCKETEGPADPHLSKKQALSWAEAADWWTNGPLLRSAWVPRDGAQESVYAISFQGGKTGSPTARGASVLAFYEYPPVTVDEQSYWKVLDAGGWSIAIQYFATAAEVPFTEPNWSDKKVTVRGHSADLNTMRRAEGDGNNWRTIRWNERASGGAFVQWEIGSHSEIYSEGQMIDFTNRLVSVR